MKLNRKWLLIVALVLSVAMATTGTLAYLTDDDADVNTMVLGKVEIVQNESQRVMNTDGTYKTDTIDGVTSYVLEEFKQDKPLLPIVGDPHNADGFPAGWDEIPVRMTQIGSYGGMQVFGGKNAVDKFVTVTNTGRTDAFVRTFVAIEIGSCTDTKMIGTSYHSAWDQTELGIYEIEGNNYVVFEYDYPGAKLSDGTWRHEKGILPAGDTTYPNLSQVYLAAKADNEDLEDIDGNGNGKLDILVLSQAVQADGFEEYGATAALNAGFGIPTENDNIVAWFSGWTADDIGSPGDKNDTNNPPKKPNGDLGDMTFETPADAVEVATAEELAAKIAEGETVFLLKAGTYHIPAACKNKTLTLIGEDVDNTILEIVPSGQGEANGQLDYNFDGSTVTFQNLTIKSNNNTYAGYARMTGTYKNVNFENHYSLQRNSAFEYCTLNVSGDQYNVWTWGAPVATFTNCTFNSDGKAVLLYGAENTKLTLTNCVFNDTGVLPDLKAAVEIGNDYNKSYELIANNVEVNGYEVNDKGIPTGSTLWANKNSMGSDKLNVVVDGVDIY